MYILHPGVSNVIHNILYRFSIAVFVLVVRIRRLHCALSTAMVVWLYGTTTHAVDLHIHTSVAILYNCPTCCSGATAVQ